MQVSAILALPAIYLILMAVGFFLFVVDFLLLLVVLEALLLLQMRAHSRAGPLASPGVRGGAKPLEPAAVEAADRCFLAFVANDTTTSTVAYLVFLYFLDLWARARLAGADGSALIAVGVLVSIGLVIGGRAVARATAWRRFAARYESLWTSAAGLDRGRNARSVATYLDWRQAVLTETGRP